MFPVWLIGLGLIASIVVIVLAFLFFTNPRKAFELTHHHPDHLPAVMGGRYLFLAAMLVFVLFYDDAVVAGTVSFGFAGLGALDAVLYRARNPWPHAAVGVLALLASLIFFSLA